MNKVKLPQIHFILGVSTVVVERHHDFCNIKRNYQDKAQHRVFTHSDIL